MGGIQIYFLNLETSTHGAFLATALSKNLQEIPRASKALLSDPPPHGHHHPKTLCRAYVPKMSLSVGKTAEPCDRSSYKCINQPVCVLLPQKECLAQMPRSVCPSITINPFKCSFFENSSKRFFLLSQTWHESHKIKKDFQLPVSCTNRNPQIRVEDERKSNATQRRWLSHQGMKWS